MGHPLYGYGYAGEIKSLGRAPQQQVPPLRRRYRSGSGRDDRVECSRRTSGDDTLASATRFHRDHRRVHPAGNRYFTVNGTDAVKFSHSMSSFPLAPPASDSVILSVSTGDGGLPMVSEARPNSVAGSLVVAPS